MYKCNVVFSNNLFMVQTAKNWSWTSFELNAPNFDDSTMLYLCYQREIAPETAREHWQGYVALKSRKSMSTVKSLLGSRSAHLEVAKGSAGDNRTYCSKQDTAVPDTFREFGELPRGKGERTELKAVVEALEEDPDLDLYDRFPDEYAKFPRFCDGARRRAREKKAAPPVLEYAPQSEWQRWLVGRLDERVDERKVHWFVDPVGGSGKSFFAGNYRFGGRGGYVITGGKHSDIYYGYSYEGLVIFDWSRSHEDAFPYGVVESFKNGYFLNTKYESRPVRFKSPHVVVFSNFEPDRSKLSADRWDVHKI